MAEVYTGEYLHGDQTDICMEVRQISARRSDRYLHGGQTDICM
jgi:hypothetical protein